MCACTFFGHRDCPDSIRPQLRVTLEALINNRGVDVFYVGNQGQFDRIVRTVLRELQEKYPHIRYAVVLAYLPAETDGIDCGDDTMFPEGMESVHPRYAIVRRNQWLIHNSEFVVCYVRHAWGGAYRNMVCAMRRQKYVVNLWEGQRN